MMNTRQRYSPGPASVAHVKKDGEHWTLVLTKELRHSPDKVWQALTDPSQLREWAPFDADRSLGTAGATAVLTTLGAPAEYPTTATTVKTADQPHLLVYNWGGNDMRWELAATEQGTHLSLWTTIPRGYIAMGAAGWHLCFDVLDFHLSGDPIGRIAGPEALKFEGWQRLHAEYKKQFAGEGATT